MRERMQPGEFHRIVGPADRPRVPGIPRPRMKNLLALALSAAPVLAAQEPAPAVPIEREQPAVVDARELLEPLREKHGLPALAGAAFSGGRLVAVGATGERELGGGVPVSSDDLWHLGSCTKAMTATLAARLVEKGAIAWDAKVVDVLADWKDSVHAGWHGATLEWLLQNRGGAPGAAPRELWSGLWQREGTPQENRLWFARGLLALEPALPPGSKFQYSNQGFTIAGVMLERAGGASWEDLMRREVFEPLGMRSAGFGPPGSKDVVDQPRGHAQRAVPPGPRADNPAAIGPAGNVHASLEDWGRFAVEHLRGARGTSSYLAPESWKRLHTSPDGQDYAMGWGTGERSWAGGRTLSHSGSNTMWYCTVWLAPERDDAYLVVTNAGGDGAAKGCDEAIGALIRARAK